MGDSSEIFSESQERNIRERQLLEKFIGRRFLILNGDSIPLILKHIDYVVRKSQGNKSVENVNLYVSALVGEDDDFWDKVGQVIGNLQSLGSLHITPNYRDGDSDDDEEDLPIHDSEILARILRHVRQRVTLFLILYEDEYAKDIRSLATAIRGHPTITGFDSDNMFPHETLDALYSALATLPALESIRLFNRGQDRRTEDEFALANPERLTDLLRVPSLRSVCLDNLHFTPARWCDAIANALMEGTRISKLDFTRCSFSSEESAAIMANGLARNTSVVSITVEWPLDGALIGTLAVALASNTTLQELSILSCSNDGEQVSRVFLALGKNTGLKTLKVDASKARSESVCAAIHSGLGTNETLEKLELMFVPLCDENVELWCSAFSFLSANEAIKSLVVDIHLDATCTQSCLSTFCIDIVARLQMNTSLESLSIKKRRNGNLIEVEEYFILVTALQHNTTLKSLSLFHPCVVLHLNDDESKRMASLLKKNYALERLPNISLENEARDVGAILRLNEAGRRYLIEDGSSISKGVEVLSRVNNDITCVFLHLLENPRLCDQRAVEMLTTGDSIRKSIDHTASSSGEKREQASAHTGSESRRRLA
jgi:hypothetical protein